MKVAAVHLREVHILTRSASKIATKLRKTRVCLVFVILFFPRLKLILASDAAVLLN